MDNISNSVSSEQPECHVIILYNNCGCRSKESPVFYCRAKNCNHRHDQTGGVQPLVQLTVASLPFPCSHRVRSTPIATTTTPTNSLTRVDRDNTKGPERWWRGANPHPDSSSSSTSTPTSSGMVASVDAGVVPESNNYTIYPHRNLLKPCKAREDEKEKSIYYGLEADTADAFKTMLVIQHRLPRNSNNKNNSSSISSDTWWPHNLDRICPPKLVDPAGTFHKELMRMRDRYSKLCTGGEADDDDDYDDVSCLEEEKEDHTKKTHDDIPLSRNSSKDLCIKIPPSSYVTGNRKITTTALEHTDWRDNNNKNDDDKSSSSSSRKRTRRKKPTLITNYFAPLPGAWDNEIDKTDYYNEDDDDTAHYSPLLLLLPPLPPSPSPSPSSSSPPTLCSSSSSSYSSSHATSEEEKEEEEEEEESFYECDEEEEEEEETKDEFKSFWLWAAAGITYLAYLQKTTVGGERE